MLEQIGVEPLVKGYTMQFSARSRVKEGPTSSPVATQGRPGFMGGVGRQTHTKDSTANFRGIDGLTPEVECYNMCNAGWEGHVMKSLYKLIEDGVGTPQ